MNQINSDKTCLTFNKKLFEMKWKNPGSQFGSLSCDPNFTQYTLGKREKSNIFNFDYTLICIERCLKLISKIIQSNGKILIVSTDPFCSRIVKKAAEITFQPYINTKWTNGLLTNWKQIIPNRQISQLKSSQKQNNLSFLTELPAALIVVNPQENSAAIREANKLNIPVISFLDLKKRLDSKLQMKANQIDYLIPSSGSATEIVYLFFDLFARIVRGNSSLGICNNKSYCYSYIFSKKQGYSYSY